MGQPTQTARAPAGQWNVRCELDRIALKLAGSTKAGEMFREGQDTVFILGAGASWHYGYPLGESLVERVIEAARDLAAFYKTFSSRVEFRTAHVKSKVGAPHVQSAAAARDCEELAQRLAELNPPVIDHFLGHSSERIQEIGRLLIALVVLQCEFALKARRWNRNRKSDGDPHDQDNFRTNLTAS
jgi:hypothetical protein